MKKIINWNVDQDPHTKKGEIELHFNLHSTRASDPDWNRKNENRLNAIRDAEKIIDKNIQGNVLEIGAGNGYASVDLSKRPSVESVHSLECDEAALNKLIRRNYQENNVPEEKYELVLGSFNDIKNKDYYDFVVALGVIHHSGNLLKTLDSIFSSLKPEGFLIAQEPFMDSLTPNSHYINKESKITKVQNLIKIKESDRDDHFFRMCEYQTAFHHAGFNINYLKRYDVGSNSDQIFNFLTVLQKPKNSAQYLVPHRWLR